MGFFRSVLFNLAFAIVTLVMAVVGLPMFLRPRSGMDIYGRLWAKACLWLLKHIVGLDYEIRGDIPSGACLIAAKHQSAWETLALAALIPNSTFVLKRILLWTPPFGPFMAKVGMIPIDRSGGSTTVRKMLAAARRMMEAGRPIVIFPEGTRRAPGAPPAYHPGVAALYRELKTPVIPVAVNSGLYWRRNAFTKRQGVVIMEFLEPIPPGMNRKLFMREVEDRIETATIRLVEEGEQNSGIVRQ
jgi:1-acyl-sn-glycerol-3-phosphate acyltransferase